MDNDTFITKEITNHDVYKELVKQGKVQNQILEQAKKTNGRVTKLEKISIGMWIACHPVRFAMFCMVFMGVVISDIRHPLVSFLMSLI
jgi:hypothetical protein